MRVKAISFSLGLFGFLLTGCGGGSSSSSLPAASSGSSPSATATAVPTGSPSPYPLANGEAFAYSGTLTQTFQSFVEIVPPGTPSPEPTSVTTENVTQNLTVRSNQAFNGGIGLYDLHSAESDADASGLETTTSTTDTYEAIAQSGAASSLLSYGSQFTDEAGDTMSTMYSPLVTLDELPETAGASWQNGPGATIDEAVAGDASGSPVTVARTVNADGSYNESTTYPPNYSAPGYTGVGQIQENSDGSGVFSFVANGAPTSITYSAPEPQPSGPPLITINEYAGLDTTATPAATFQLATWYGNAPALYSESDLDQGVQSVPSSCGLAASLPKQASVIARTVSTTDTVIGYTDQQSTTGYVALGYGVVCTIFKDVQTSYYDFSGDQAYAFTETSPLEITTTTETLALQPSATGASVAARKTVSAIGTGASLGIASALQANFQRLVLTARHRRAAQLLHAASRVRSHGGAF